MAFVPVPNTIKVALEAQLANEDIVNTLHVRKVTGGDVTPQNVFDVTNLVSSIWRSQVVPLLGSQYDFNQAVGTDLSVQSGFQSTVVDGSGQAGGINSGTPLPNSNAFCMTLRTGFSGRSARGRMYLPSLRSVMVEETNLITFATAINFQNALVALVLDIPDNTSQSFFPVVVSRFSNNAPRPIPFTFIINEVGFSNRVIDSQDRRMPRG